MWMRKLSQTRLCCQKYDEVISSSELRIRYLAGEIATEKVEFVHGSGESDVK